MSQFNTQTMVPGVEITEAEKKQYYVPPAEGKVSVGYLVAKRIFDVVLSVTLLLLLLLPMLLLGVIVFFTSKGPMFYRQERLGTNGKPFMLVKYRSMRIDAEKDGPQWAKNDDDRCTVFGRFLRKTRLDELPQFWNILMGDMSFVGPRPERSVFYEEFETYIHGFSNRLAATPGLTGWAQVNGGYDLLPEEKIVYDMEYINNRSVWMDLKCLLMTFHVVFTHKGAR